MIDTQKIGMFLEHAKKVLTQYNDRLLDIAHRDEIGEIDKNEKNYEKKNGS